MTRSTVPTIQLFGFGALGFGAGRLAGVFAKPAAWRVLDVLIAVTMTGLGAAMLLSRV